MNTTVHPIRLLQILASNKLGGAEGFFCRLAQSFEQSQLKQTLMLRQDSPYVDTLQQHADCVLAPFSGAFDFRSKKQLQQLIEKDKPDIVMTWMNRATQLTSKLYKKKNYQHIARLGGYYNLKYYQHCDHFIGNTKAICDYLLKAGIAKHRIHYISNFADETPGTPLKKTSARPLLVSLGRLHQNKGFDTLIRAMIDVKDADLWIAGTGPLQQELQHLIEELHLTERVRLLGWMQHPADLLASADIFICPSRHEPLGNVILEAFAQQKPVISTQNQGAVENITDGETGILTPVDQSAQLAAAINHLLQNTTLCQQLTSQGYRYYQEHFSKEHITQMYIKLFSDLTRCIS